MDRGRAAGIVQTLRGEYLVHEGMAVTLRDSEISGLELRRAESSRGQPLPWYQLIATHALPAMVPSSRGILVEGQCPHCRRDGYFGSPTEEMQPRYPQPNLKAPYDVMRSWEHFGNSRLTEPFDQSHLASALLLVRPKVMELLLEMGFRGIRFKPVEIEPREQG
jgi:hypothetical protein